MTLTVDDRELIEALRAEAVSVVLCNAAADRLQSLLSDRDKLEQRVRELEEERCFIAKWVERGMFDKHIDAKNALETIAYYPAMPWHNGRWDVDHKPYAARFYKTFPSAALIQTEVP